MSFKPLLLVSSIALAACAAGPAPIEAKSVEVNTPDKAAAPAVKPEPAKPAEPLSKAPDVVPFEEMGRIDPGPELADVSKAFAEKLYFDGQDKLAEHAKKARAGGSDYQLQVLAMSAYAHAMMGEGDLALRGYRKVLSRWQHPKSLARKLRRAHPEDGDARVERAMDAFGEALFFMAERKRAKLADVAFPYNDVGDAPNEVKRFVTRDVARWLRQRAMRTRAAVSAYQRIDKIQPETPFRWVAASHARQGAMYAQTLQQLRDFAVPASWEEDGDSAHAGADGKPLSWTQIRSDHEARMAKLMDPLHEQAKASFQACVDVGAKAKLNDAVVMSCKRWLKANEE
jgi:hypothetical protein